MKKVLYTTLLTLDELNSYLPVAELCFKALSTKAAKLTLWSTIYCYFVDPDVWKCVNDSKNIVAIELHSEVFTNFKFLLLHCLRCLNHQHLELSQDYSIFCCTLQATKLCSVNCCCSCSHVLFHETEWQRHQTMLLLFVMLLFHQVQCSKVQNIYLVGDSQQLHACGEYREWKVENHW